MKDENQKLSFAETLKTMDEICDSAQNCFTNCPFMKNNVCIVETFSLIKSNVDEIEAICTEWKNAPSLADKINEILKPYGMKLFNNSSTNIWIDDNNFHSVEEVRNKLETTKWKGEPNE